MKVSLSRILCIWAFAFLLGISSAIFQPQAGSWQRTARAVPLLLAGLGIPAYLWGRYLKRDK